MKMINLCILMFLLQSCDFVDDKLYVVNNANYDIHTVVNFHYPDTSFENSEINFKINANDTGNIIVINDFWPRVIKEIQVITVFFVNRDSLKKYDYTNWRENVHPLKKMVLSESQLDSLNWTITYP